MADIELATVSVPYSGRRFFPQSQFSFNVAYSTTRNYIQQDQLIPKPNSVHTILAFILPVLLNFLELRCQGKANSPFDTHPISMWVAIVCLLAYCLVYGIELRCSSKLQSPIFAHALHYCILLLGSLSLASLASTFFPDSVQPVIYLLYTLLAMAKLLYNQVTLLWKWIHHRIAGKPFYAPQAQERRARRASADEHWLWTNTSMDRQNILPL